MVKLKEVHANAFDGRVLSGSVEDLEKYLFCDELKFSDVGKNSFLWNSKIPISFYNKHPKVLQQDMLTSMKSELKINEMLFLEVNKEIVFCAPSSDVAMIDPKEKFPMLETDQWKFLKRDYNLGIDKYVYNTSDFLVKDEYTASAYLEIPLLYNGKMSFEAGMYKVICSNGLVDNVNASNLILKKDQINNNFFQPIVEGLITSMQGLSTRYSEFLNYLKHCPIGLYEAKKLLEELIAENVLPGRVGYYMFKYFNLIETGKVVDELLPSNIGTYYDVLDALTYYAQKMPTLAIQKRIEARVFEFMYKKYTEDKQLTISKLNLKAFLPVQQKEIKETEEFILPNVDKLIIA